MTRFEVGKTYYTRSMGDHNCIISATIIGRTAKTVTADLGGRRGIKTFRPRNFDGAECFNPYGRYSMAPIITATYTKVLKPDWEE